MSHGGILVSHGGILVSHGGILVLSKATMAHFLVDNRMTSSNAMLIRYFASWYCVADGFDVYDVVIVTSVLYEHKRHHSKKTVSVKKVYD